MHILTDVTDMHDAQRHKARAHFQRMMMNNVSHEFKTPLNAIISSAHINIHKLTQLADRLVDQSRQAVVAVVEQLKVQATSAEMLMCLVNAMIDMGHSQVNKL